MAKLLNVAYDPLHFLQLYSFGLSLLRGARDSKQINIHIILCRLDSERVRVFVCFCWVFLLIFLHCICIAMHLVDYKLFPERFF